MPQIEQALWECRDHHRFSLTARSAGFRDEWVAAAEQLCMEFGKPPAGVAFPECVFAYPLVKNVVAVVQARGHEASPGVLSFRVLAVPLALYATCIGDPFQVVERFPADWRAAGELAPLTWPDEEPFCRTVADVQRVLQRTDSPLLLGAVQALVDGSRLAFVRPAADSELLRSLWMLLPTSLRGELWPASFAFGSRLRFHAMVVPPAQETVFEGYLTEEQAENYPEGRYEFSLQSAVEADDPAELDMLFARRSARQTLQLGVVLLFIALALAAVASLLARI